MVQLRMEALMEGEGNVGEKWFTNKKQTENETQLWFTTICYFPGANRGVGEYQH